MKIKCSIFFCLLTIHLFSQPTITPVWNFEPQEFEVCVIKMQEKNGEITENDTSCFIAEWTYLEASKKGHLLQWTIKDQYEEALKMIYLVSESGEFIQVENWKEIKAYAVELFKTEKSLKAVKKLYKDEWFLMKAWGNEIMALHEVYTLPPLTFGDTVEVNSELYNFLVDGSIQIKNST
ncbi:MAG: hypothetical protein AAF598_13635 [Bacteroidota bacterium]